MISNGMLHGLLSTHSPTQDPCIVTACRDIEELFRITMEKNRGSSVVLRTCHPLAPGLFQIDNDPANVGEFSTTSFQPKSYQLSLWKQTIVCHTPGLWDAS